MRILFLWFLLTLGALARPLDFTLVRYEGREFHFRLQGRHCYYLVDGLKLAARTLGPEELRQLRLAFQQSNVSRLPGRMVQPTCDSYDRLSWGETTVQASDAYQGPHQAEFRRFRQLVTAIRKLAPLPPPSDCQAEVFPTASALVPGRSLVVYFRLRSQPGWHTYWQHPGESGLASEVQWTLPEGFQVGPLEWSLPQRFQHEGITTYGYESGAVLRQRLQVPARLPAGNHCLKARLSWLACDVERCVPGRSRLEFTLPLAAQSQPKAPPQARWPQPWLGPARAWRQGEALWLEVDLPQGALEFFPAQGLLVQEGVEPQVERHQGLTRLGWKAFPAPQPPERLQGLLCLGEGKNRRGYWIDIPIGGNTP
jgi:hypothetical protein